MTIIYDTYETEPATNYSGSYRSRLFLPKSEMTTQPAYILQRIVIGDTSTRYIDAQKLVGRAYLLSDFPTIQADPSDYSGSWYSTAGFSKHLSIECPEEQYQDSVLGHPINYYIANGITSALANPDGFAFADSRLHTKLGMGLLHPSTSINLWLGSAGVQVGMTDGAQERFCDNVWTYTGPFQSRYKNVQKIKNPSIFTPYAGTSEVSWSITLGDSMRRNKLNLTNSYNAICYLMYVTSSTADNEVPSKWAMVLDGPLWSDTGNFLATFPEAGNPYITPQMSINNLYFGYFGFGDDYANFPQGFRQGNITINGKNLLLKYPVKIRGWRYGIANALPYFTKAVFRSNHYGQFRDMLEPRKFTKFYSEDSSLQGPVKVVFKSGTLAYSYAKDYVTATNPSYNLYDSGIYDYEYKSGFGFVDRESSD